MDKTQNAATPGRGRDYQQEAGMESRVNAGEQRFAKAGTEGKDKSELNTNYSLETILERGNLNAAYKCLLDEVLPATWYPSIQATTDR